MGDTDEQIYLFAHGIERIQFEKRFWFLVNMNIITTRSTGLIRAVVTIMRLNLPTSYALRSVNYTRIMRARTHTHGHTCSIIYRILNIIMFVHTKPVYFTRIMHYKCRTLCIYRLNGHQCVIMLMGRKKKRKNKKHTSVHNT